MAAPRPEHTQQLSSISAASTVVDDSALSPTDSTFGAKFVPKLTLIDGLPPTPGASLLPDSSFPRFIPPKHESRTLVLCFDGTGDQFDNDNSNIVQLVSLLKKDDSTKQLVYYQTGIGTTNSPSIITPLMSRIMKTLDSMIAYSLDSHVMAGYEFLMQNYLAGDKICLFGFSRGAYTARSLAGMLHKVGLLPAGNHQQIPFAYKMYKQADDAGWEQSNGFKKAFCIDVPIEFVGVWDTVDSVGIIGKRLPFTTSNTIIRNFRHAVSLDERRAKFRANLWNKPTVGEAKLGTSAASSNIATANAHRHDIQGSITKEPKPKSGWFAKLLKLIRWRTTIRVVDKADKKLTALETANSQDIGNPTNIEEVWFAGCHCDVGGGSVSNKTRNSLARIPLRWMVRQCFLAKTGIMFHSEKLIDIGIDPATLYPLVVPRPEGRRDLKGVRIQSPPDVVIPIRSKQYFSLKDDSPELVQNLLEQKSIKFLNEDEEDLRDALSPNYDQLKIKKIWWVLEYLWLRLRKQQKNNEWVIYWGRNKGSARKIPHQRSHGFKVHRSVQMRMEAEFEDERERRKGGHYEPRTPWKVVPTYVD